MQRTQDVCSVPEPSRSLGIGNTAPVFLPRKFHGQKSLVGCSPWGCHESDITDWARRHMATPKPASYAAVTY